MRPGITKKPLVLAASLILFVTTVVAVMVFWKNEQAAATVINPPSKEYSAKASPAQGPSYDVEKLAGGVIPMARMAAQLPIDEEGEIQTGAIIEQAPGPLIRIQLDEKARKSPTEVFKNGLVPSSASVGLRAGANAAAFSDTNTLGSVLQPVSDMYGAVIPKEVSETDKKEAFLAKHYDEFTLSHPHQAPPGRYVLGAGAVIPALMKEGIVSDLPGEVRAQVSQTVYDTSTGEEVLIPQGATLFGRYDAEVIYGQNRLLVAWHRLMYPDGSSRNLDVMSGADEAGAQGFEDQVNNHYLRIFGSATLLSVISAGTQLSQPQRSVLQQQDPGQTAAAALGQNLGGVATQMVNKNLSIKPTITIRPGYRFVVKVNKDITFEAPWRG